MTLTICFLNISMSEASRSSRWRKINNMWHDQGKWVACRKFQFLFSYTTFSIPKSDSFWCKPHYNWITGYRVMTDLTMLKTIWNKGIWTLFLPISQKQHPQHPTHSSWSCHISSRIERGTIQATRNTKRFILLLLRVFPNIADLTQRCFLFPHGGKTKCCLTDALREFLNLMSTGRDCLW